MQKLAMTALLTFALLITGCMSSEVAFSEGDHAYIRLTEYRASYPIVGGVTGCQVSQAGQTTAAVTLSTENCQATINEQ
jgi:hypothetical protein